jgi:hypothetical protein
MGFVLRDAQGWHDFAGTYVQALGIARRRAQVLRDQVKWMSNQAETWVDLHALSPRLREPARLRFESDGVTESIEPLEVSIVPDQWHTADGQPAKPGALVHRDQRNLFVQFDPRFASEPFTGITFPTHLCQRRIPS